MTLTQLSAAILVLLVTPGPTNTLLAVAGAERGWRGALPLVAVSLAGYLATILPLALLGGTLVAQVPGLPTALTLAAAVWVAWLAVGLWRPPAPGTAGAVTARGMLVTTLLNPKALVFGLILLPAADLRGLALHVAVFAGLAVTVTAAWAGLGALVARPAHGHDPGLPPLLRRASALWLVAVAVWLAARVTGLVA